MIDDNDSIFLIVSHGKFLPMAQVAILKYSIKCERFRL